MEGMGSGTSGTGRAGQEPPRAIALPQLGVFTGSGLEPRGDYDALHFAGLDFAGQVADDAAFLGCRLERCGLDGVSMRRARISETLLEELHATSLDAADSVWRDTLVTVQRVGALLATGAAWSSVRLRGGRLDLVDLSGAKLHGVTLEGCIIGELDLGGVEARNLTLDGCEIEVLDATGARLVGADLTGAAVGAIRGVAGLRGATITSAQLVDLAPQLAAHVGLKVRDA
jgi:uncharacterized protein YjbI with pentapeptide repeats